MTPTRSTTCSNCGGPGHRAPTCEREVHYKCPECGQTFTRWPKVGWRRGYCEGDEINSHDPIQVIDHNEGPRKSSGSTSNVDLDSLVEKITKAVTVASGLANVDYDRLREWIKEHADDRLAKYSDDHLALTKELQEFTSTLKDLREQVNLTQTHVHQIKVNDSPEVSFADDDEPSPILEDLLLYYEARQHPMLWGPSGCGKSYAAEQAWRVIKETKKYKDEEFLFVPFSFSLGVNEADLYGRMLPNGDFIESKLLLAYEKGGMILMDEMDAADQNLLIVFNRLLEYDDFYNPRNSKTYFKNERFWAVAATNTNGRGPSAAYTARNRLDMATLTRFNQAVYMSYSETVERKICKDNSLLQIMWAIRNFLEENNAQEVISTRHIRDAYRLMVKGMSPDVTVPRMISTWAPNLRDGIERLPEWNRLKQFSANITNDMIVEETDEEYEASWVTEESEDN